MDAASLSSTAQMLCGHLHQSATALNPLTGEVNNNDYPITVLVVGYITKHILLM